MDQDGVFDYAWLNADSEVAPASCFAFFENLGPEQVLARAGVADWQAVADADANRGTGSSGLELTSSGMAVFREAAWTIAYAPNAYPEQFATAVAAGHDVTRSVIVFWNINAVTDFSFWENGVEIAAFDWPQERRGADPDRLLDDMRLTVGLNRTGEEPGSVFDIYQQMLALAERITETHLGADFLQRRPLLIGYLDDETDDTDEPDGEESWGAEDDADSHDETWDPTRVWEPSGAVGNLGPIQPPERATRARWDDEQRRRNESVLDAIPRERWAEIPAWLARYACERVGIADSWFVDEILDDLDRGRRPSPARLTSQSDIWAIVEDVAYHPGGPSAVQLWAAIEAMFAAAKPKARQSPLGVLLYARQAVDDEETQVIDQLRADMT